MEYSISYISDFENLSLLRLHATLLNGGKEVSRSYLRWKYLENPYLPEPTCSVIRLGDEVVGFRGLVGSSWYRAGEISEVVLPMADDLIIHPQHRRRGLFVPLNESLVERARELGFNALLNLSGGEQTQALSLVSGWQSFGKLTRSYRSGPQLPQGLSSLIAHGLARSKLPMEIVTRLGYARSKPPVSRLVDKALSQIVIRSSSHIHISSEADYSGMSYVAEATGVESFRASRSESFFRWRLRSPHRRYRFVYWRDSKLRGYMILSWARRDPNRIMVADFAAEDRAILSDLMSALTTSGKGQLIVMSATLDTDELAMIQGAGFTEDEERILGQRRQFLFYPLQEDFKDKFSKSGLFGSVSDSRLSLLDTMAS